MAEVEELDPTGGRRSDYGPNASDVAGLIDRARTADPGGGARARPGRRMALAAAGPPRPGELRIDSRPAAIAAARVAGRAAAAAGRHG